MLDINKRLNDIIFSYGLDRDYPNYRKGLLAERYIKKLMSDFKIRNQKVLCLAVKNEDIAYFSFLNKHIGGNIDFKLFDVNTFDQINLAEYDKLYAISLRYAYIVHKCQLGGYLSLSLFRNEAAGIVF